MFLRRFEFVHNTSAKKVLNEKIVNFKKLRYRCGKKGIKLPEIIVDFSSRVSRLNDDYKKSFQELL
jgi:hypothetical protein